MKKTTFAVIIGNRAFFPDALAKQGRKDILDVLKKNGFNSVALSMGATKYGTVETYADAKKCAELFAQNSQKIDGIIVTLPNFGDERASQRQSSAPASPCRSLYTPNPTPRPE